MRKLDGLRFLQDWFGDQTVDCSYFTSASALHAYNGLESADGTVWHARVGRRLGSELETPVRRCDTVQKLRVFGEEVFGTYADAELVVHRVTESFYTPLYVGSIAVYHRPQLVATIEFQATEAWCGTDALGARPRDWLPVARFTYPFLARRPANREGAAVDTISRSHRTALAQLWDIADRIAARTACRRHGLADDTVTRFNLYHSGKVLLDDHRSVTAFSWGGEFSRPVALKNA